ncbi:AAA domain-containing protein [Fusarium sp. LHS14.1]|nr:AAA domain-containing protein [Fusarium sp. LHS14.1]
MSLDHYQAALPHLFSAPKPTHSAAPSTSQSLVEVPAPPTQPKPSESTPTKGFVDITEYHTEGPNGREVEIIPTKRLLPSKTKNTKKQEAYKDYAIILRRTCVQRKHGSSLVRIELEIHSEALCRAFRNIAISSYETTDLESFPIKLQSPFSELFFYRDEIKSLMDDENNSEETRRSAEALHDFILNNGLIASIFEDHERYSKEGQVVADILWTIYPPNSLVVLNFGKIRECWICRDVSIKRTERGYFWEVVGLRIGYDGASPGLTRQTFRLPMTGMQVMKISDLPLIPAQNYQDWPSLKKTLHARAVTLQKVLGKGFSSFASQTYTNVGWMTEFRDFETGLTPMLHANQLDERVVVDYNSFLNGHRNAAAELVDFRGKLKQSRSKPKARGIIASKETTARRASVRRRLMAHRASSSAKEPNPEPDVPEIDSDDNADIMEFKTAGDSQESGDSPRSMLNNLTSLSQAVEEVFNVSKTDFSLLFPALVPAFGLKNKKWLWILSDQLQDVTWNMAAFETLQLETETKQLVKALVKGHKARSTAFDDVVPGKGQGLVFLLHGKPGLGKTLTAEGVADYLERPLYSISGGELSTEVTQLEKRLDVIFGLTKRWDAVCLLDEADVLLGKRNSAEMDRNAIVAVFLRKIEYFQGVMFLTTNRKQDFDEAFKSRIHVTISYGDLSDGAQAAIWERLIVANKDVEKDDSWTPATFEALGRLKFNGRTIKNILRTAVAYANADDEALGLRHVLAIVQTELKDVDEEPSVNADSLESPRKAQVKTALDDLQRLLS